MVSARTFGLRFLSFRSSPRVPNTGGTVSMCHSSHFQSWVTRYNKPLGPAGRAEQGVELAESSRATVLQRWLLV